MGSNIDGSHEKWSWGKFFLSGLEGGLQGAATFGIAFAGGRAGVFTKYLTTMNNVSFMNQAFLKFGSISWAKSITYATQFTFSNIAAKFVLATLPITIAKFIIDLIIPN